MATPEDNIPHPDEYKIQDLTISTPLFKVISQYVGMECDNICKEFMLCRHEERDPRKCLKEGMEVTKCGLNFVQEIKKTCRDEAEAFARCIEWNDWDFSFEYCRREQKVFDKCMEVKMKRPKPPFGYFSQLRVHESTRPRPVQIVPEFPDRSIGLPQDYEGLKDAPHRHGSRYYFYP